MKLDASAGRSHEGGGAKSRRAGGARADLVITVLDGSLLARFGGL